MPECTYCTFTDLFSVRELVLYMIGCAVKLLGLIKLSEFDLFFLRVVTNELPVLCMNVFIF